MQIDLHMRTVLVTGAASGIGAAAAQLCAEAGAMVVGIDTGFVSTRGTPQPGKIFQIKTDIRHPEAIVNALAASGLGMADGLILSAAVPPWGDPVAIVQTNYAAAVSNALDGFRVIRKSGSIVAISSTAAYRRQWPSKWHALAEEPFAGTSSKDLWDEIGRMTPQEAYRLAKWALNHAAPRLFSQCATQGIRLNYLVPGPTESAMSAAVRAESPEAWKDLLAEAPFGVANSAQEVAGVITFLMSETTRNLHGSYLHVDGGWYAIHGPAGGL